MATQKQQRVVKILSENPRKSVSGAMREAGYSSRSAEKPQELTGSKGWKELMAEALPDVILFQVHRGLLKNSNWRARDAGLEKAYRLKGLYAPARMRVEADPLDDVPLDELLRRIEEQQPLIDRYLRYSKEAPHAA